MTEAPANAKPDEASTTRPEKSWSAAASVAELVEVVAELVEAVTELAEAVTELVEVNTASNRQIRLFFIFVFIRTYNTGTKRILSRRYRRASVFPSSAVVTFVFI